jgi:hypothetical protein
VKAITIARSIAKRRWTFALVLAILCVISFGLLIPWLGFYWDDWPFIWLSHVVPPADLRYIEIHRPLTGWLFMLLRPILGESPLRWQMFNLGNRWLIGVAMWWASLKVWPERREEAAWVAFAFTLYPGYGHQHVSVNSSRHLLPLAFLAFSFGLSALASRKPKSFWKFTCGSITLSLISMLTTDYYFGLEMLRPIFIWAALEAYTGRIQRLERTLKSWLPSLTAWLIVVVWRFFVIPQVYYQVSLSGFELGDRSKVALQLVEWVRDLFEVGVVAWTGAYSPPHSDLSPNRALAFVAILATSAIIVAGYLWILRDIKPPGAGSKSSAPDTWWAGAIVIGIAAMLGGAVPSWVTGLPIELEFSFDRLTLPMMMGAAFLLVGLLRAVRPHWLGLAVFAIAIGFAAGKHFRTALSFRADWDRQKALISQLLWRAPAIVPGTAILTQPLPLDYETDNSISALINWVYAPANRSDNLQYMVFDLKLRDWLDIRGPGNEQEINHVYRTFAKDHTFRFSGSTGQALVIYDAYPACLRVVEPLYDQFTTGYSSYLTEAIDLSRTDLVIPIPSNRAQLPPGIFGAEPQPSWCYYYEKADLARQIGDWDQAAQLAVAAVGQGGSPHHASEYGLFAEALARSGRLNEALDLTQLAIARDAGLDRMLCAVWERVGNAVAPTPDFSTIVDQANLLLGCQA